MSTRERTGFEIAVVGMAGRFPGARDIDALWNNLRTGVEGIRRFSPTELQHAGVPVQEYTHPCYVPASGYLEGVDQFAAVRFGITAREADRTDPQHRLLLELAHEAIEESGIDVGRLSVGVYASCNISSYLYQLPVGHAFYSSDVDFEAMLGNDKDYLATRIAYRLDLRGPAQTVQTACSSSLVAVHAAVQALLAGECDAALAGGSSIVLPQDRGYVYRAGTVASPDGHCRPFDADAEGTVVGNGGGMVLLRRLADAEREGDPILAVILGSAVNNDGAHKASFTAPRPEAQRAVVASALSVAAVAPDSVVFVEAHGTGTRLGDPIEVAALRAALGTLPAASRVFLGSLKSNLGHLNAAAGVASLIKTVLVLQQREVPPTLHFRRPNPQLELGPLVVNTELEPLPNDRPLRAGVSSFGMGGTNVHVVLEDAALAQHERDASPQLLAWSAHTSEDLLRFARALELRIARVPSALRALSNALLARSPIGAYRAALVVDSEETLRERLRDFCVEGEHGNEATWLLGMHQPNQALRAYLSALPSYRECSARAQQLTHELGASETVVHTFALATMLREASTSGARWQSQPGAERLLAAVEGRLELADGLTSIDVSASFSVRLGGRPTLDIHGTLEGFLHALSALWRAGVLRDLKAFAPAVSARASAPALPLVRSRHWIDAGPRAASRADTLSEGVWDAASAARAVQQAFAGALGAEVELDDDFFALGGESLLAVRVCDALSRAFGREVSPELLFAHPVVGTLAEQLFMPAQAARVVVEQALNERVVPYGIASRRPARSWLLTGSTGFLGSHLCEAFLRDPEHELTVLVRAQDESHARRRVQTALSAYRLWQPEFASRLRVCIGDVASPRLGLSHAAYDRLAESLDGILHAAAQVHFGYTFAQLQRTNVAGTEHVLALATHRRDKVLHHVSTAAVFEAPGLIARGESVDERALAHLDEFRAELRSGYQQSKWAAELLVGEAAARGVRAFIHRPGSVWGHSRTGLNNPADFTIAMLLGCTELGVVPAWDITLQPATVDYVASAIAALAKDDREPRITHLTGPEPGLRFAELIARVNALGHPLRTMPYDAWRERVARAVERDRSHRLAPFLALLGEDYRPLAVPLASARTREELQRLQLPFAPIDDAVLERYFTAARTTNHQRERTMGEML